MINPATIIAQVFALVLLSFSAASASAQPASPGPYEILPFDDGYIVEAFTDLLPNSNTIADWTGWTAGSWESPNAYNNHGGTDFSMGTGTPIYAITTGTVIAIERSLPENNHNSAYYYGNYVKIQAAGTSPRGESLRVLTAHMLSVRQEIQINTEVTAGQLLGYSDNTGNSTSEHCHVESSIVGTGSDTIECAFYHAHYKYPIMLNPTGSVQVGHVVKVHAASTPIRSDRFESSPVIATAHQDQLYFASFAKRGYYRVFIPNDSSIRSGWIKAVDVAEVIEGIVVQPLPDAGAYVHSAHLASPYPVGASADAGAAVIGQVYFGGGRFVSDQAATGDWYRIAVPGASPTWGWIQADSNMVVYPQLHNPQIDLAARIASQQFPFTETFSTVGIAEFGRPKFDRNSVVAFSPASAGGDGKALFMTDSINSGDGIYDTVSVGRPEHRDYFVQSDVYFRYQPSYGTYERYGIFLRDDGFGGFDETFEGKGNCYAMTWDSDDGYLRCCKIVDAVKTDFSTSQIYMASSGWHTMRIEAEGTNIRYYLDGVLLTSATDSTFISGLCGIGYTSHIGTSYPPARGAYFDNFVADTLPVSTVADWVLF